MFVRKKKNRSGTINVIVVDKSNGHFKEIKNFGVAKNEDDVSRLSHTAQSWIRQYGNQQQLDFRSEEIKFQESLETERVLSRIDTVLINGTQLLLSPIYDSIGFGRVGDDILRHLAIARVCQPQSKLATVSYLKSYYDEDVDLFKIYRYMDILYDTQREQIQRISVEHTRRLLGGSIGMLFYDVTTLYFESSRQDILREPGFSKDGKTAESQIVLGLLVSANGYPLSYSIFNGSQYEGYTMLPVVDDFIQRFSLTDFVVVADAGLMSKTNIDLLRKAGYKYIIGGRIRNESKDVKEWALKQDKYDKEVYEHIRDNGERIILSYSLDRAKKDAHNREKGVQRLEKAYKSGRLTKESVNKRGYNKFLTISKDITVEINHGKIEEDATWDGLKSYVTNTSLDCGEVINQYHGLWVVERAFRITKGTLDMRPMFHFTEKRMEAHVCICFVAYKLYKELERIIALANIKLSVDRVLDIAKTITTIRIQMPYNNITRTQTLFLTTEQKSIEPLFNLYEILQEKR